MAIQDLIQEIKNQADKEIDEIINEAKEEAKKIINEARNKAKEEAKKIEANGQKQASIVKGKILAMARRKANKHIIEAKEMVIQECIDEAKKELKNLKGKKYENFVEKSIKEAMNELKDCYILASRKDDEKIAKKIGIEARGKINAIGGVIIKSKDGSKEIDATFDFLLEKKKEEIRIKIAEKLWK